MTTKPQAIALLGFAERSIDTTGSAIDTARPSGSLIVISRISSIAGAGAGAVVIVEDSADGQAWAEVARFDSRAAVTDPPDVLAITRVGRYVRAKLDASADPDVEPQIRHEVIGVLV